MTALGLLIIVFSVFSVLLLSFVLLFYYWFWDQKQRKHRQFNQFQKSVEQRVFIHQVASAIFFFVKKKIGALIILQGKKKLQKHFVDKGILLDANCSTDLLKNIFTCKNSQMHDGAVIVDNNYRIAYASVLVSLSKRKSGFEKKGSRHHAATSITNKNDAAVIIVSETTGQVSFVTKNKITKIHQPFIQSLERKVREWSDVI